MEGRCPQRPDFRKSWYSITDFCRALGRRGTQHPRVTRRPSSNVLQENGVFGQALYNQQSQVLPTAIEIIPRCGKNTKK